MRDPVFRYHGDKIYPVPHFPLAVVSARHPDPVPIHTHDFAEFVFVRQGSATHVPDEGGERRRVSAGDVLLLAQGERHAYIDAAGFEIDNLMFRHDLFEGRTRSAVMDAFATLEPLFRRQMPYRVVHLDEPDARRVQVCLGDIREELARRRAGFRSLALARFIEAIVIVGRASRTNIDAAPRNMQAVAEPSVAVAEEFMRLRFAEPLTLAEIADAANLSPTHFCAVFKAVHGTTPWQYLHELRIAHAVFLLAAHPAMSIAQIASATGFSDPSYFARVFRRVQGHSPKEHRAQPRDQTER
jgi:AraC-like DNA-binding protein